MRMWQVCEFVVLCCDVMCCVLLVFTELCTHCTTSTHKFTAPYVFTNIAFFSRSDLAADSHNKSSSSMLRAHASAPAMITGSGSR